MLKKIFASASALMLATSLVSCAEQLDEVDVNGLSISDACAEVREAGWKVAEVASDDYSQMSDCSDNERNVIRTYFSDDSVTLYYASDLADDEADIEESSTEDVPPAEEAPAAEVAPPAEEQAPAPEEEQAPPLAEEDPAVNSASGYQEIYDEYAPRLENECPSLSMSECAELANEGVSKMADYMYRASGTDGQYQTYETWSGKLYDVYMASFR